MLQLQVIRNEKERILEGLKKRNWEEGQWGVVERVIDLDTRRRALQTEMDKSLAEQNRLSGEIGTLFKQGKKEDAEGLRAQVAGLKEAVAVQKSEHDQTLLDIQDLLYLIPNIPHASVPVGRSAQDNVVYKDWGKPFPVLHEGAMPHWELATKYKLFDLELGVKLTGSGFPVFRGKGARLERALISFFLDAAVKAGYEEIMPPLMVNEDTARGTGQLPDKEAQMYFVERDNLYLIPTAEVPVTNILRDTILNAEDLPVKMAAYTPCFRREAGSYGADVRGLNRVHQFDKVEIVQVVHPARSYEVLQQMLDHVADLLERLELPYRILLLCGGDMGFTSAKTYDFEVYSAAQQRWLEVSSVSNFENYQSNRMKLRYREGKETQLAHTLNGSALALARIVAALLENNQTPDGIVIPEALRPYTGFDKI